MLSLPETAKAQSQNLKPCAYTGLGVIVSRRKGFQLMTSLPDAATGQNVLQQGIMEWQPT